MEYPHVSRPLPHLHLVAHNNPPPDTGLMHRKLTHIIGTFRDFSMLCERDMPPVKLSLSGRVHSVSILRGDPVIAKDLRTLEDLANRDQCALHYRWDGEELVGELSKV